MFRDRRDLLIPTDQAQLKFQVAVPDADGAMQVEPVGLGGNTHTHTAEIHSRDQAGKMRTFATDEPVWLRGRTVENLLPYSNEFSTGWTNARCTISSGVEDPDGGTSASTITATDENSRTWRTVNRGGSAYDDRDIVNSVWLKRRTGAGPVTLAAADVFDDRADITSLITTEWQRFSVPGKQRAGSVADFSLWIGLSGDEIDIYDAQMEDTTGHLYPEIPSEVVRAGAAATTKTFDHANGNTVSGNIVTNARGARYSDKTMLACLPDLTNLNINSRDLTGWVQSNASSTYDQTGVTGFPSTATQVNDNDNVNPGWVYKDTTVTNAVPVTIRVWVKKGRHDPISLYPYPEISVGWGGSYLNILINTETGDYYKRFEVTYTGSIIEVEADGTDWWVVTMQVLADNTTMRTYFLPASSTDFINRDDTLTGSRIVGNVEVYDDTTAAQVRSTGPVFTAGASVTVDGPVCQHDILNHSDNASIWLVEFEPQFTAAENIAAAAHQGIVSVKASLTSVLWLDYVNNRFYCSDGGTSHAGGIAALAVGEPHKVAALYDPNAAGNDLAVGLDGSISEYTTYDGSFNGTTFITLGYTVEMPFGLRDVKRYACPSYAVAKQILERMMLEAA